MEMKKRWCKKVFALAAVLAMMVIVDTTGGKREAAAFAPQRLPQRQLILDAGHGGEDGGAVSVTGAVESHINLAITLKLDHLLGFYGIDPILTRKDDRSLHNAECETLRQKKISDLHNRVAMVEETANALLVSIHQNTFPNPAYHGAQVFYREGEASEALAKLIQDALRCGLDPENGRTPAKIPDSVYLMKHITCPAVLVECGFLSNAEEEKKLRDEGYQTQLAVCVASAVLRSGEVETSSLAR